MSQKTVRKVLRSEETSFEYERDVQPRSKATAALPYPHWQSVDARIDHLAFEIFVCQPSMRLSCQPT